MALGILAGGGCASVLGGLDEGTSSSDPSSDGGPSPAMADTADRGGCRAWLAPFRYRVPLIVTNEGPAVAGYQVKVVLPTSALVASQKLQPGGVDLRVTAADGVTVLPYWIESVSGGTTILWTRVDVAHGATAAWVYYGNAEAVQTSSLSRTFVAGVVDDPSFDRNDAWAAFHDGFEAKAPSSTNEWSVSLSHDAALLRIVRGANPNTTRAGICQSMLFPSGSQYRFLFDVNITLSDVGNAVVTRGGLEGEEIWISLQGTIGRHFGVESLPIASGISTLCLLVSAINGDEGHAAEATYSNVHVRRYIDPEPTVGQVGPEQESCR